MVDTDAFAPPDNTLDTLLRIFDASGNEVDHDFNTLIPSVPLQSLRRMARDGYVVGVATGDKAAAVRAALTGGYFSAVVLDNTLAEEVLGTKSN